MSLVVKWVPVTLLPFIRTASKLVEASEQALVGINTFDEMARR